MPRPCSYCNKLASLETEAELQDGPEVQEDGSVTASVRLVRKSACCGDEMKEYTCELENSDVTLDDGMVAEECTGDDSEDGAHAWQEDSAGSYDPEVTERSQTHDRHGRPIKNFRYSRSYIGVLLEVPVKCKHCGATGNVTLEEETTAGSFDEL